MNGLDSQDGHPTSTDTANTVATTETPPPIPSFAPEIASPTTTETTSPLITPLESEVKIDGYRVQSIREMTWLFNQDIPVVFLGGQMGTIDEFGNRQPVTDRDALKQFCEDNQIYYYDPTTSEPEKRSFINSRFTDKTGVMLSEIDVLSLGKESPAGVSIMEALFDLYLDGYPQLECERILYFPDSTSLDDIKFDPPGIKYKLDDQIDFETTDPRFVNMYFEQALKTGNLLRSELIGFTKDDHKDEPSLASKPEVQIFDDENKKTEFDTLKNNPEYTCLEIKNDQLHMADIIDQFSQIFEYKTNKKFAIYLHPPLDENKVPIMNGKDSYSELDKQEIVQQFITQGNHIRKILIDKLRNDPHTTFTFSQEATKQALKKNYLALKQRKAKKREIALKLAAEDQKVVPNYMAV